MHTTRCALAYIFLFCGGTLWADEPSSAGSLVRPVVTDYQRSQLHTKPSTVAIVHSQSIIEGGAVAKDGPEARRLQADLQEAAKRDNSRLYVILRLPSEAIDEPGPGKLLEEAVRGWAKDAGFQNVDFTRHWSSTRWHQQLSEILASPNGGLEALEPVIQNTSLRLSPINTALSRFLAGNADCVVEIRQPFDGRTQEVPQSLKAAIREAIDQANPSQRERLVFHLTSTTAGRPVIERAFSSGGEDASINQLARELGFRSATFSHSPCGGAPETLLSQPAPNFTLEQLDGGELTLADAIRGKPAFVSFWGVACGPCRREAPHLTALHRQFADQGFVIVAVNAYNEKREAVQAFAEKSALSHPIVLMGRDVAHEQYKVGAYPTGFWVDHTGHIIDYTLDFLPGEEVEMAERIKSMLEKARQ
jgi:thiol-disulfide isomerase/thioredoxin